MSHNSLDQSLNDRGRFRWVSCQLKVLRRSFPSSIRDTLETLPKTLDATYEHILLGIDEEKWEFAHRLFQCLSVSVRPLRVEELAEILAVRFDPGALPRFHTGWRLGDADEAVLSACSSLITVINVDGFRVVQFAHFSVKEFLTSHRLPPTTENLSRYHIVPHLAHTTLAQASLGVLLQLNDRIDKESIMNFPLADYAARHWLGHRQFGEMLSDIQDATKCLFDRARPSFSAWIWIYDIDDPWRNSMPTNHPEQPEATPLYYAILCGFPWLVEHLISTYPGDVNTRGGYHETPLLAAVKMEDVKVTSSLPHGVGMHDRENWDTISLDGTSHGGHVHIVQLLLDHSADVDLPDEMGETPLFWASKRGKIEIAQLLIGRGAEVHSRNKYHWTPLKIASRNGHFDVVRFLINNGADVNSSDDDGWSPLHSASREGHVDIVEFLFQNGADVNQESNNQETPLYWASARGKLEILQTLVERGVDVHSRSKNGWTLLKTASHHGHLDVVRFLIDNGADVNSSDDDGWSPLHSASQKGHVDIVEFLIQNGTDVNRESNNQKTPLYLASTSGKLEILQMLVERGADVHTRSKNGWTVLQTASHFGHLNVARLLIDNGTDLNSHDHEGWTPLHAAASEGHVGIVELLLARGADFSVRDGRDRTPLVLAYEQGNPEVAERLLEHIPASIKGSMSLLLDRAVNTTANTTPSIIGPHDLPSNIEQDMTSVSEQYSLWTAAQDGQLDIVRSLLDSGSDVNDRNTLRETALDVASSYGHLAVARLLIERGADVNARDRHGWTPLIAASRYEQLEVARLLLDHGADVNAKKRDHETALHYASRKGNSEMVRLLLEHGAKMDVRDTAGKTPMQIAL